MNGRIMGLIGVLAAVVFGAARANGQCADWREQSGLYGYGYVDASTVWDPDGAGPQPALLVVGGSIDHEGGPAGPVRDGIAAWDGTAWHSLGTGLDGTGFIEALTVYNGELIAAGAFESAGGVAARNIARWNGTAWQPLGSGVGGANDRVSALTVRNGELIAGGDFDTAGGVAAGNIARWNGSAWSGLGAATNGQVTALAVMANGDLAAGGQFSFVGALFANRIARWNGSSWSALGAGMSGFFVSALAVMPNGDLVAGGDFAQAGGFFVNCIARWDGSAWQGFGSGMGGSGAASPAVLTLGVHNGQLIAGGRFTTAGDRAMTNIARWDGQLWQPLQGGVGSGPFDYARTMSVYGGNLMVGGGFQVASGNLARGIAPWNGSSWSTMPGFVGGRNGYVYAQTPWSGGMVLAGHYGTSNTNLARSSVNLTMWNGATHQELGNPNDMVLAATTVPAPVFSQDLVVGGLFTSINGVSASRIARINSFVATGWQPMGAGFNGVVEALLYNPDDGGIYAGGSFTASGATPVSCVARWNGSSWQPLGTGIAVGPVFALKNYNGALYAGGTFTSAGGATTGGLARWNGSTWSAVSGVFQGTVYAMAVFQNRLIIAGQFAGISDAPSIVAFDGTSFSTLGSDGVRRADSSPAVVRALTVSNGTLIAGGAFATAGGVPAANLARWDGAAWSAVGGGVEGSVFGGVYSLATLQNEVHVGGDFNHVGGGTVQSPLWARFSETGAPWLVQHPAFQSRGCGDDAAFSVTPAAGYDGLSFQWQKNGLALSDGPTGTGSVVAGATGPNLIVDQLTSFDAGDYTCVVTNACGSTTSGAAELVVNGTCPPVCYANCDGSTAAPVLTVADFACFLNRYAAGSPYANCDGSIAQPALTVADFACFLNAYAAGCP